MNSLLPRRFYSLLLVFGALVGSLFVAATLFFPECSVERISAYLILTMGTCVLMCAIGLALTHRWIEQHFTVQESGNGPDTEMEPASPAKPRQTDLKPATHPNNIGTDKPNSQCVVSATN
ncbi:hypothetical protein [Ralstonia chuxiongensis]|uniref:hypothetical protein n=1 Tax=Ralstonia chuxiongensis TaxID=2957504 RepID=UPI0029303B20|nr:hypothetical protein [Ralstonia chuxiongensis]